MAVPTESQEQQALFEWVRWQEKAYPELGLLVHIPNGGYRNKREAMRFKAEGVRRGFPDLLLPVARGGYHSLAIEIKRQKGGTVTPEQKEWLAALNQQGYLAIICNGWHEASEAIMQYLRRE